MKKIKKRNFLIHWEIYPFDVMVSFGEKQEEVVKKIERSKYKLSEDEKEKLYMSGRGRTVMLEGGQTIMRLDTKSPDVIAHEVFHAVAFLMARIKINLTYDSDEAFAYAIEFLTKKIYANLIKKNG